MKKLTPQQLTKLHDHLIRNNTNDVLLNELLDHLACEAEAYLWKGYNFDLALETIAREANTKAVKYLSETYRHEVAMTDEQLREASLDDIIFEFRNKAYGAYDLRQSYPFALRSALILGIGLFLMLMAFLSGMAQGSWDFFSASGAMWIVGLCGVTYAIGTWFFKKSPQNYALPA
ncbi:MAG: hypothetical protein U0X91_12795 [Spirosomataceae bacterium]